MTRRDWEVLVGEDGRSGTVTYREAAGELRFYWEFGGGDAVASIAVGTAAEWDKQYPWAAPRRDEILQRVMADVIRQRAPTCTGVVDDRGWITLYQRGARAPGQPPQSASPSPPPSSAASHAAASHAAAQHFAVSARKSRIVGIFAVIILALSVVAWLGRSALQIRTTGAPWGSSMRAGNTVITLMTRLEPYIPSLNRNHGNDRYNVGLLLHEAASGERRYMELARGRAPNDLSNAKLLAVEGTRIWVQVPETMLYDVASGRIATADEVARDRSLAPPDRPFSISDLAVGERAMLLFLAEGGRIGNDRWLGVHTPANMSASFREGFRAPVAADFERSAQARQLYTGALSVEGTNVRLGALQATGVDSLFNGAFVRSGREGGLLLLAGNALMVHETKPRRAGTVVVSRVSASGDVAWSVDTGIGQLLGVLPDASWPAFVGERPRIPGQVPEPILVIVDASNGRATTRSLWMKD